MIKPATLGLQGKLLIAYTLGTPDRLICDLVCIQQYTGFSGIKNYQHVISLSQEKLSSGFETWLGSILPAQLQKLP